MAKDLDYLDTARFGTDSVAFRNIGQKGMGYECPRVPGDQRWRIHRQSTRRFERLLLVAEALSEELNRDIHLWFYLER